MRRDRKAFILRSRGGMGQRFVNSYLPVHPGTVVKIYDLNGEKDFHLARNNKAVSPKFLTTDRLKRTFHGWDPWHPAL